MELKFIKGSIEKWAGFNAHDDNSFYVVGQGEGDGKIALYLGNELIASGNTVAALEAEISLLLLGLGLLLLFSVIKGIGGYLDHLI